MKKVQIYTDGACSGNPGKGGYGIILVHNEHRKELSGGYRLTTNNRMEMMAAIIGLEALKMPCDVTLYTDSRYLVDAITKGWAKKWQGNGWKRNKKETAKNPDLWQKLLDLCEEHEVEFVWVKGHAGHPENEQCDRLAVTAAQQSELAIDEVYEEY
ncbi:ribonuclease H [Crocosphaera subtropica ATCC 51142]|uniref:Ribonuclease H n=1 Tax=Crocosphaera subtropica (strain ATCC 51142 / BH68) TaxID=43989 RepID=B1WTM3_CROS5|nr:ribonuclease HI [Crocosphaera subtropica]ACB53738.1 ribonuclease H [Crocosphaera subtropica ATCC 51142]